MLRIFANVTTGVHAHAAMLHDRMSITLDRVDGPDPINRGGTGGGGNFPPICPVNVLSRYCGAAAYTQ